jgi:DNA replication initiation complex subunit (GINS family)
MARVDIGGGFSADPDVIQQVIDMIQGEYDNLTDVIAKSKTLENTVAPGTDPVTMNTFHKPMQASHPKTTSDIVAAQQQLQNHIDNLKAMKKLYTDADQSGAHSLKQKD